MFRYIREQKLSSQKEFDKLLQEQNVSFNFVSKVNPPKESSFPQRI